MGKTPSWLSSREAAALLSIKLATLYAYTSRGLVESVPGPRGRGRRYARDSIERLKARHDARSGHGAVAAGALRFGEPALSTSISDIRSDGPYYRGRSALALCAQGGGFEAVFDLLVTGQGQESSTQPQPWTEPVAARPSSAPALPTLALAPGAAIPPSTYLAALLATAALADETRQGASDREEHERARRLTGWLADQLGGARLHTARATRRAVRRSAPGRSQGEAGARVTSQGEARARVTSAARPARRIAERVLIALGASADALSLELIDRALILCADHELNASTFAARVAASTGADLYASLCAALHTLSGPLHGGASAQVEALLREIPEPGRAAAVMRERLARGERVPGFGQPLYPRGDPRGRALFELAARAAAVARGARPDYERLIALSEAMQRARHPGPNLDAGLVAVSSALALPAGSAAAIFAIGRMPGWVAHALEQRSQHYVLRPRARYVPSELGLHAPQFDPG